MKFIYFTKTLQKLDVPALVGFCKATGLDGADMAVRPGFPVAPDNSAKELPRAAAAFKDAGLSIGLVSAPTGLIDPESRPARAIFDACGEASIPAVKIGYFPFRAPFDACLKEARAKLAGFAKLAEKTKAKAVYHTHSGAMLGNNAAGARMLLDGLDPHHAGAFLDTGHTAINGGPPAMEFDLLKPWVSLVAIKDMAWTKAGKGWRVDVVPVGDGIVDWPGVGKALKALGFKGTISLHGEYEAKDLDERKELAKKERAALKKHLGA
ncbi:MAG: sugar phosphate isomerase/epimerase [Gemmataceae bacterium]|nr:sugar phosphate isomerase/epimerase [Gemmataceae bacterium]